MRKVEHGTNSILTGVEKQGMTSDKTVRPKEMTMDTEWIEHHGKGYPDLPMDTLVQVRFVDGEEAQPRGQTVEFWCVNWRHDDDGLCDVDITHYRVVAK